MAIRRIRVFLREGKKHELAPPVGEARVRVVVVGGRPHEVVEREVSEPVAMGGIGVGVGAAEVGRGQADDRAGTADPADLLHGGQHVGEVLDDVHPDDGREGRIREGPRKPAEIVDDVGAHGGADVQVDGALDAIGAAPQVQHRLVDIAGGPRPVDRGRGDGQDLLPLAGLHRGLLHRAAVALDTVRGTGDHRVTPGRRRRHDHPVRIPSRVASCSRRWSPPGEG